MATESVVLLMDELKDHLAFLTTRGREPDWQLVMANVTRGYKTTILIDGSVAVDAFGRSLADSHHTALVLLRRFVGEHQMCGVGQ